jgi:DNA polymerase-3 subunit delta'
LATLAQAAAAGHLGHALLITGPDRIGKRVLAEHLALRLLCEAADASPEAVACGHCRSCRLVLARSQRDPVEHRPDGRLAHPFGHANHPDLYLIGHAWRQQPTPARQLAQIGIEQVRALSSALALTPQYGRGVVAIIDPAEDMTLAAANALLKTLEEPVPGRVLMLLAAQPERLPATIRSRCQRSTVTLPTHDEALAWLAAQGHEAAAAREALDAARGHPGLAGAWLRGGALALRREVTRELQALRRGEQGAVELAQRWVADDHAALRLRFAADWARDEAAAAVLTDPARGRRLAAWFDAVNRVRAGLSGPVRADLAVAEVLAAWSPGK